MAAGALMLMVLGAGGGYVATQLFAGDPREEMPIIVAASGQPAGPGTMGGAMGGATMAAADGATEKAVMEPKKTPDGQRFLITYYEFPGSFTTNLSGSTKFLQATVGLSTQYDSTVIRNVEKHDLALRAEVLSILASQTPENLFSAESRAALQETIKQRVNAILEKEEGFAGIEQVYFTSLVVQ